MVGRLFSFVLIAALPSVSAERVAAIYSGPELGMMRDFVELSQKVPVFENSLTGEGQFYDLRESVLELGVVVPKDETLIYDPPSALIYHEGRAETVDFVRTGFERNQIQTTFFEVDYTVSAPEVSFRNATVVQSGREVVTSFASGLEVIGSVTGTPEESAVVTVVIKDLTDGGESEQRFSGWIEGLSDEWSDLELRDVEQQTTISFRVRRDRVMIEPDFTVERIQEIRRELQRKLRAGVRDEE